MTETTLVEPIIGSFDHSVDGKGRVVLPQAYRPTYQNGLYLSHRGSYLGVYPAAEWRRYAALLEERCLAGQIARTKVNEIYANTSNAAMDSQGRILIGQLQRDQLGLGSNVRFRGHGNHLGLYPRTDVGDFEAETPRIDAIVDELSAIGL